MEKFILMGKIIDGWREMEKNEIGKKFINILELLYVVVFALGISQVAQSFSKVIVCDDPFFNNLRNVLNSETFWPGIICLFVLIRFFFAPSKNISLLGEKNNPLKFLIMPIDVGIFLTLHAFLFYRLCACIPGPKDNYVFVYTRFYEVFNSLLIVNVVWLLLIWLRVRKSCEYYIKFWIGNNLIFFILIIAALKLNLASIFLLILALGNSLIDLFFTYPAYLKKDKKTCPSCGQEV